jgi:hypothetical protein
MNRRNLTRSARILAVAGAALFTVQGASASSVRSVSVNEMIDRSEVVFEGRVLGRRVVDDGDAKHLRTCVRFEVLDVVKGGDLASPLELCFAGGRAKSGTTRGIAGMNLPAPGEHGIYFVESLADGNFSPLLGWDQGRFVVSREGKVSTAGGLGVVALDASSTDEDGISDGVALGARVAHPGARGAAAPMDAEAFKARVRELAGEGR